MGRILSSLGWQSIIVWGWGYALRLLTEQQHQLCATLISIKWDEMHTDAYNSTIFWGGWHTTIIKWIRKHNVTAANHVMTFSLVIDWMVTLISIRQRWYWRYWDEIRHIIILRVRGDIHATIKWLLEHIFISANPYVCMGRYQCSGISMWKLVGIPTIAELHLSAL